MSRRPLSLRRKLAALACAAPLLAPLPAHSDTCTGLSLAALAPGSAGGTPNAVAVGDFDRDGKMDVAVANSGGTVAIRLGSGMPGPNSPITTSASNPIDIAAGDLDRDGILDLVVAFGGSQEAEVLRGLGGVNAGGFTATGTFGLSTTPSRIYLADFNRDADLDLVVLAELASPPRVLIRAGATGIAFGGALTDLNLTQSPFSFAGEQPSGAAVLDFNRDGNLDLAVSMRNQNKTWVLLGSPGGSLSPGPFQAVGTGPRDVAAGDVNRDGWPDLVTADSGAPGTASVLTNTGGMTPVLNSASTVATGGIPTRVALVDLDHDSVLDLAALDDSATGRVASFRGLKTGPPWFDTAACVPCSVSFVPGAGPRGLAVGRITADGRTDLLTALSGPGQLVVVENQSGTPCARSSFAGAPRSYAAGNGPVSTAAADFNRDGRQDLAVVTANEPFLRILRNDNAKFTIANTFGPLPSPPTAVAAGDLNVDGRADVVVARGDPGPGLVEVFLDDGLGGFASSAVQSIGSNAVAVAIGDFDGDGDPDVAAAMMGSDSVYVFLGDGLGGLSAGIQTPLGVGTEPRALVAGFFNADANLDLAVANFGNSTVSILGGNGNGSFSAGPVLSVGTKPQGIAAAHLDADSHLDLVTADNGASRVSVILRDSGTGAFLTAVGYPVGTNPTAVALADLMGADGRAEIAVTTAGGMAGAQTLTLLVNNGSGVFAPEADYPVRNSPQAITPIDVDTDGLVDLAVPCRSADAVVVLINRPPGPPRLSAAPKVAVRDKPRSAVTGDFNRDGILDIAVANSGEDSISLLRGDGNGGFSETRRAVGVAGSHPAAIGAGDFNRDGWVDLAISLPDEAPTPSVLILYGSTTVPGDFNTGPLVTVGGKPDDMVVGDFDRDGDPDIALCDLIAGAQLKVLQNDPGPSFTVLTGPGLGDMPTAIVAVDFDRDGDLDLAVANAITAVVDVVKVLTNTGSFAVTQMLTLADGDNSPLSLATGDFDADGLIDLAVAAFSSDRLHVYRNLGTPLTPFATTPGTVDLPVFLKFVTAADVNLDGKPDLLAVAGGLSILRGKGGLLFDPAETVVARDEPAAAVVGDFNRDGRPDVAVVNEGSDDVSLFGSSACSAQRLEASLVSNACDVAAPYAIDATVEAFDDGGNTATCATGSVDASLMPPTAVLGGQLSVQFTAGIATFTGLTVDSVGRYRLQFQTAGTPPVLTHSFTLVEGGTTQILGPASVCPGDTGVYSTNRTFDTYAWTLTPPGAPPFAYTPTVSLTGLATGSYNLDLLGRDECVSSVGRNIYFGDLLTVMLSTPVGPSSVCVDCIGGSVKAIETGGGTAITRQWGYRTATLGPITSIPGETGETYVLKGTSFPGPGTYFVVVTTTPAVTCGSPKTSNEWMVTVDNSLLNGEVRHLAASSRGNDTSGENRLLWVNTTGSADEIKIRWNKAPDTISDCTPPLSHDSLPVDGEDSISPTLNVKASYPHVGLELDTTYCYSVFVHTGLGWSPGRTVKARPFDSAGRVKWAFATGGTAVTPPTVSAVGIMAMSNDHTVHALTRDSNGGDWPTNWVPTELVGVAHSRSPVVPFVPPLLTFHDNVLFAADDASPEGFLHAINAGTGVRPWSAKPQTKPTMGAPGGMFMRFGGVRDLLVVGTRHDTNPNALRGLSVTDGSLVEEYTGAGSAGQIGPILGSPAIGYPNLVYFASRRLGLGDTLFCVEVRTSAPFFVWRWSRNLGDIETSPVLLGGRIYVGTVAGTIYSLDALNGDDDHTFTPSPADGRVKGFLFPDRRTGSDDLIFATDTKVWSISDDGIPNGPDEMSLNWQWSVAGLNPSVVLYWPGTNFVYVGSRNGELYELDFTNPLTLTWKLQVLGSGQGQVGAPSLDIGVSPELLIVGSEAGVLYGVAVPF
jgi:hypothetical protein